MSSPAPVRPVSGRRNAAVALGVLALVAVLVALPAWWRMRDAVTHEYPTYAAARDDGAVADGRLPPFTPASATDIHRQHRRGAGTTFLRFTYAPADSAVMTAGARRLPPAEVERLRPPNAGYLAWWPLNARTLRGSQGERLRLFELPAERGGGHLALDPRTSTAFHWRTDRPE